MNMDEKNPRHDSLHHQLFGHREVIEDLMRRVIRGWRPVGGPWIDALDWSTLKREPEVSTSRKSLLRRVRDIVWSVQWQGSRIYLILLIEFQSRPDPYMALRQLTYLSLFYEDLIKSKRLAPGEKLPPALPICLYNGEESWRASPRLEDLVAPCPKELKRYQIRFCHLLIEELRVKVDLKDPRRNSAGSVFAIQQVDTKAQLLGVLKAIERWLPPIDYEALRRSILDLVMETLPPELEEVALEDLEEFRMSPKESLAKEIARDRAADLAKGRAQGRVEGQRRLLENLLRLKFGPLSPAVLKRLDRAGGKDLESWAAKVLTAATLEGVFASS